jgi:hypothetical protein
VFWLCSQARVVAVTQGGDGEEAEEGGRGFAQADEEGWLMMF